MATKIFKNNRGYDFKTIYVNKVSIFVNSWLYKNTLRSLQKYTKIFSGVILVVRCRCTPSIVAKLSVCCSSQLGIIQLLYPLMLHYRASLLPIISNVLRTNTMFTAIWLIYMLTARFVWLIHTSSSLA